MNNSVRALLEQMTIRALPLAATRRNDLAPRMTAGRPDLSASAWCHCSRRFAGVMIKRLRLRLAERCANNMPASIVLPKPTSSAKSTPYESGLPVANSAASIWCGCRSTGFHRISTCRLFHKASALRQVLQQKAWFGGEVRVFALHGHIARLPGGTLQKGNRQAGQFNGSRITTAQVHHAIGGEPAFKGASVAVDGTREKGCKHADALTRDERRPFG